MSEFSFSIVFLIIVLIGSFGWKSYSCSSYGDLTNRDTKYTITNGCFVKFEGKFIPRSELERRYIMSENGSLK